MFLHVVIILLILIFTVHPYEWQLSHVLTLLEQLNLQQYTQSFTDAEFSGIDIKSGFTRDVGEMFGVSGPHIFKTKRAFDIAVGAADAMMGMFIMMTL